MPPPGWRDDAMTHPAKDNELVITKIFDAPRELVYRAFTDPDQLAQWFGPVGFSVPRDTVEIDARVGGQYKFVMVSDDDPSMAPPVNATFTEVVENELLAGSEEFVGVAGMQEPCTMNTLRSMPARTNPKLRLH